MVSTVHCAQGTIEILTFPNDLDEEEEDFDESAFDDLRTGKAKQAAPRASGPGLTSKHLLRFFDPSLASSKNLTGAHADESGFFGTYRRLFERLAEEERIATPYTDEDNGSPLEYPSFGYSHTPYVFAKGDEATVHQTQVKDFYAGWTGFASRKGFGWADKYRGSDAPDRRIKRLMEKENKRDRDTARREYNDTVRSLAAFLRKRDPRVKAWQQSQAVGGAEYEAKAKQTREEANKRMKERQAAAERHQAEMQDWQKAEEVIVSDFEDSDDYDDDSDEEDQEGGEQSSSAAAWKLQANRTDGEAEEEGEEDDPSSWTCVACDKFFRSEAAFMNHEQSKKHKQEVRRLRREMHEENDALGLSSGDEATLDSAAAQSLPPQSVPSSRKSKKKQKKQKKAQMQAEQALADEDAEAHEVGSAQAGEAEGEVDLFDMKHPMMKALIEQHNSIPMLSNWAAPQTDPRLQPLKERPPGSFDVFGYGSLIFKPPPHVIGRTPGFIKGFMRRFAQHSVDHRGTPERPGRVVTLISSQDWHKFKDADAEQDTPEGDIVWGYTYTIDPDHALQVKAYLDWREKNGYTETRVTVWASETEKVLDNVLVYVGLPDNPAFVGPSDMDELAMRIFTCEGPSGRNDEYLLSLAEAVRHLAPQVKDSYLFGLEERVLALRAKIPVENGHVLEKQESLTRKGKKGEGKAPKAGEVSTKLGVCGFVLTPYLASGLQRLPISLSFSLQAFRSHSVFWPRCRRQGRPMGRSAG